MIGQAMRPFSEFGIIHCYIYFLVKVRIVGIGGIKFHTLPIGNAVLNIQYAVFNIQYAVLNI